MAYYEHVFVARPDVSPAQVESLLEELKALVEEKGGKVGKTEYWGLRTLAYRMHKNRKGHYGLIDMEAGADVLEAIDQRQRYSDDVIRYLTVRIDELSEEPSAVLRKGEERKRRDHRQ
jgi:small subunit ribosomal protein S6